MTENFLLCVKYNKGYYYTCYLCTGIWFTIKRYFFKLYVIVEHITSIIEHISKVLKQ